MLKQHENFEISAGVSELKWVVRQERFELADDAADVQIDGEIFRIINYSATGIVVVSSRKMSQPVVSLTVPSSQGPKREAIAMIFSSVKTFRFEGYLPSQSESQ